jgi:hypothetical protein
VEGGEIEVAVLRREQVYDAPIEFEDCEIGADVRSEFGR